MGSSTQVELHCRKLVTHVSPHHPPASVSTGLHASTALSSSASVPWASTLHRTSISRDDMLPSYSPHRQNASSTMETRQLKPEQLQSSEPPPSSLPLQPPQKTAMITCHRRATSSGSLSSAFLFTYRLLGLFSVYRRMLEDHPFSHVVSWAPVEITLS